MEYKIKDIGLSTWDVRNFLTSQKPKCRASWHSAASTPGKAAQGRTHHGSPT